MKSKPVLLLLKSQALEIFYPNFTQTFYQFKFDKLKLKKLNLVLTNILKINNINLNNFLGIQIHD